MKSGLVELLELYEYKVDDLVSGMEPKGGLVSLSRLRQTLIQANLPGPLGKKFREIDLRFKANRPGYQTIIEAPANVPLDTIVVAEESPTGSPEQQILEKLAEMVYWSRLERDLVRANKHLSQGKRDELRLIFAIMQNLETYSKSPNFAQDYNLSKFALTHPVPAVSDPRAQLENSNTAIQLLMDFFRMANQLSNKLKLPPEETVPYLRRFARRILETEGSLKSGIRGPSTEMLRRALEEAHRQSLGLAEIRNIQERLAEAAAEERRMAMVVQEDRQRFQTAIERIVALLNRFLPTPKGEAQWPQVGNAILGSANPAYALDKVPANAKTLTLRLRAQRLIFMGYEVGISQAGQIYGLSVAGQERTLEETGGFSLVLPTAELYAYRYQDHLHLRMEAREAATLTSLLSEGRMLAYLLWPQEAYGYLRLLRAFSARLKGDNNYGQFVPESASKYPEAPADHLQDFARKGLGVVRTRIEKYPQWPTYMREAARALGLEAYGQTLEQELATWMGFSPPSRDTLGGLGSTTVGDSPSTIKAGSTSLSLRYQEDAVYVSSVGSASRVLHDLLVWPVHEGVLVMGREGARVAHTLVAIQ